MSSSINQFSHHVERNFSLLGKQIVQPIYQRRYLVCCTAIYISSALLTTANPWNALKFIHLAYLIDRISTAVFATLLEDYRSITLVPFLGQMTHIVISTLLANGICRFLGSALTARQIYTIGSIFLISVYATKKWIS